MVIYVNISQFLHMGSGAHCNTRNTASLPGSLGLAYMVGVSSVPHLQHDFFLRLIKI